MSNVTISGKAEHVQYMVDNGVIDPFCALLSIRDSQIVQVVLDGLNNILKKSGPRTDEVCQKIEECGGLCFYIYNNFFIQDLFFRSG